MLEITKAVVNAVHTPVTAKTRLGWDEKDLIPRYNPLGLNSLPFREGVGVGSSTFIADLAEALQDCGIQELAIHGRTRSQMYRGEADWTLIGEVKNNPRIHIPIIGNGDVTTPERAKECFDRYGVDAIMIGRATFGCPWLFAEMKGLPSPQTMAEKVAVLKEHVLAAIQWCGGDERKGIVHSRRHFAASPVFKGLADFRQTRIALLRAETTQEVFAIMDDIVAKWGNE
jgi:tRNA-dihydrouridine synthase